MPVQLPCPVLLRLGLRGTAYDNPPVVGLMLEWRRSDAGWQGLVVWAERPLQGEGWELRQRWVRADAITPVAGAPGAR